MRLAITLSVFILLVGWCVGRPVQSQAPTKLPNGEPVVTIVPTATPAPVVFPAPGAAQRVQFERGSYGATLTGNGAQRFVLWAASGQVFKVAMAGDGQTSLFGTNGKPLWADVQAGQVVTATLPGNGDHLLEIRSRGAFTVGVEIR